MKSHSSSAHLLNHHFPQTNQRLGDFRALSAHFPLENSEFSRGLEGGGGVFLELKLNNKAVKNVHRLRGHFLAPLVHLLLFCSQHCHLSCNDKLLQVAEGIDGNPGHSKPIFSSVRHANYLGIIIVQNKLVEFQYKPMGFCHFFLYHF